MINRTNAFQEIIQIFFIIAIMIILSSQLINPMNKLSELLLSFIWLIVALMSICVTSLVALDIIEIFSNGLKYKDDMREITIDFIKERGKIYKLKKKLKNEKRRNN